MKKGDHYQRCAGETISFSSFMARCLQDPERGYYVKKVKNIGRQGDFTTAPVLGPWLGKAMLNWIRTSATTRKWTIIEVGGGTGHLARSLLSDMTWSEWFPTRYFMVETSPVLEKLQRKALYGHRVRWFKTVKSALLAAQGHAIILSNELVDAFPCDLLEWTGETWQEVHLLDDGRNFSEVMKPLSARLNDSEQFSSLRPWEGIRPGQRIELHDLYRRWMHEWMGDFKSGAILTIDYGDIPPALYHRKPSGTVRAYFNHIRMEGADVYARVGRQDVTADVNFSDLKRWGEDQGLQTQFLISQREFLLNYLSDARVSEASPHELRFLMDEQGAGSAFKVLAQLKA